jgi:hypothetical protein
MSYYIYTVFTPSFREVALTTDDFQKAIDCWSEGVLGEKEFSTWTIVVKGEYGFKPKYLYSKALIMDWANQLFVKLDYNRVERRIMLETLEPKLDNKEEKAIDFHGDFKSMTEEEQDAIINPKHYKLIPPEAYEKYPDGMEYMHLMEYLLAHLTGHQAHTMGHVFKYSCRVGKKDDRLQDATKIAWYANHMVDILKAKQE